MVTFLLYKPSGKSFIWKDLPNITVSRLPKAVSEKINTREPIYPPRIVCN